MWIQDNFLKDDHNLGIDRLKSLIYKKLERRNTVGFQIDFQDYSQFSPTKIKNKSKFISKYSERDLEQLFFNDKE